MSAEPSAAEASLARTELAILTALSVERATLPRRNHPGIAIWQSGPGEARAAAAAHAALASGAGALVSWGFVGALTADVACGTVALPRDLVARGGQRLACDRRWQAALAAELAGNFVVDERPLLGSARVLVTPADKASSARASGAAVVDMESAAIAAAAAAAGARFAAVRVVVDTSADALPAGADRWIDERGNRRFAAALGAALAPRDWPVLWNLGRRYGTARAVLVRLAARLVRARFCLPDAP
jgi:nucleoside phosphorylase